MLVMIDNYDSFVYNLAAYPVHSPYRRQPTAPRI